MNFTTNNTGGKTMNTSTILSRIPKEEENLFPEVVLIDNVSYCNLKCSMCSHKNLKRKQGFMNINLYKKLIDEIAQKRPQSRIWVTFYGEGLIMKDLDERIKYAKDKGCKDVVLNSNGTLLNYENSKKLVLSGLDALYVGVDAFTQDIYKDLRVGGNLETTVEGVLSYKKALDEYGNGNQKLFVQFVVMDSNQQQLDEFLKFWNGHGINVKVRPKVSWAGKVEANNLQRGLERLPCFWQMNTISITDIGKIPYCTCDLDCEEPLGDANENTIEELWNGPLKELRRLQYKGEWDKLTKTCRECLDWQSAYSEYHLSGDVQ
jgi:sulfatase maturation enzyme AslB (radical SAM superfamily)